MIQLYHAQHAAAVWAAELEAMRWSLPPAKAGVDWRVADERRARRRFGLHVERLALEMLLERGHTVALAARNGHHDLVANGVRVEVKAARWGAHGAYRFNMRQSNADLYLLACCSEVEVLAPAFAGTGLVLRAGCCPQWSAHHRHLGQKSKRAPGTMDGLPGSLGDGRRGDCRWRSLSPHFRGGRPYQLSLF
jgi:hypothetical protein